MAQSRYPNGKSYGINRRKFIQYSALALGSGLVTACASNQFAPQSASPSAAAGSSPTGELTKVTFGTNWFAEAEHGGFYQALATGLYKQHGLDVTIKMGGPQVNGTQLLMGGAIDFFMGYEADAIQAVQQEIPKVTVAAIFQKDPQILIAHPEANLKDLQDLKGKAIFVSSAADVSFWPFLRAKYGFTDTQKRPYNFSPAPFLADKASIQQGYLTSEPLAIKKAGGFDPTVFLLADYGYTPYSTTIECKQELVQKNPDLVQRFVDASIKGWYSYLQGDPTPGNALIKKANPEMTDEQMKYGIAKLNEYGIAISGDATAKGIGAMTDDRWKGFFDTMATQGVFKKETDFKKAYTLQFVNKGTSAYKS